MAPIPWPSRASTIRRLAWHILQLDVAHRRAVLERLGHRPRGVGRHLGTSDVTTTWIGGAIGKVERQPQRGQSPVIAKLGGLDGGPRPEQRQLALQQVVLADPADLVPTLVEGEQGVVHRRIGDRVVQAGLGRVDVEEGLGRLDRDLFHALEVEPFRQLDLNILLPLVPPGGVGPEDVLPETDLDRGGRPGLHVLLAGDGKAFQRGGDEKAAPGDRELLRHGQREVGGGLGERAELGAAVGLDDRNDGPVVPRQVAAQRELGQQTRVERGLVVPGGLQRRPRRPGLKSLLLGHLRSPGAG